MGAEKLSVSTVGASDGTGVGICVMVGIGEGAGLTVGISVMVGAADVGIADGRGVRQHPLQSQPYEFSI